ncbi:MAG: glutaminase A [Sporichthyaceae bacterium]
MVDYSFRARRHASVLAERLDRVYQAIRADDSGAVADYIPELAKVDPDQFGIAMAALDGHVYTVGDAEQEFTIQSISKPFVFGIALDDRGPDEVMGKIGVEPSGDAFNSIVMDEKNNRPLNPMVNAGAIACSSLVRGHDLAARRAHLLEVFSTYAGRNLSVDEDVYVSERETGHRNRAIAYLELSSGMISEPIADHLDLYFWQCAIKVTARDLATMAATLANGGVNPVTGKRAASPNSVRRLLTVMATCGMYDWSGEWMYRVGVPAKSGVAGGILAVLPGQIGVGTFSPRLDTFGNSARGIAVCERIAVDFGLHLLEVTWAAGSIVRRHYDATEVPSKRLRPNEERKHLAGAGRSVHVYQLQGDVYFATAEALIREVERRSMAAKYVVLDGRRLERAVPGALALLVNLHATLRSLGIEVFYAGWSEPLREALVSAEDHESGAAVSRADFWPDSDDVVEHCEDALLVAASAAVVSTVELSADRVDLLREMDPANLELLAPLLRRTAYDAGATIVAEGEESSAVYFLVAGTATARLALRDAAGKPVAGIRGRRLRTFGAGVVFGETALFEGGRRTADVVAETPVVALALDVAELRGLAEQHPQLYADLLVRAGTRMSRLLAAASGQIRALDS